MSVVNTLESSVIVTAENIGGIDRTEVSLKPGVNVLTGRNATNRTSFLQAVMAGLGSDRPSLRGDADEGSVNLSFGDDHYERVLSRRNGTVVFDGEPYLENAELVDLFACLLESNEARRAVGRGDDLRELIVRPIDFDELESQITLLETEKRDLDTRLEELEGLKEDVPELEERHVSISDEIEETRNELALVEAKIEELDANLEESRTQKSELEETFADLRTARRHVESTEADVEIARESRDELERERSDLEAELSDIEDEGDEDDDSLARLEGRVRELRERKRSLDSALSELQSVVRFNEERLEADGIELDGADTGVPSGSDVTGALLDDGNTITCWTCGSDVDRERVEGTLERLQSLRREKLTERTDLQNQIDDLSRRQTEVRRRTQLLERVESRLSTIDEEIDAQDDRITALERSLEEHQQRVATLEKRAEAIEREDAAYSEVLEAHREKTTLEVRLDRLESDRETVQQHIETFEEALEERSSLEARREEITDELTELRTRVERIEADAIETFNEHIESILEILEYANIDRIWIERRERERGDGRWNVSRHVFELHVVRSTVDGATYEDTIDHLSESEREVTGLVFALAGYLVHEIYDVVPFMLLDSLEAIDSDRIADLVEYFEEYAGCLVVALLPDDANALSEDHHFITEI